MGVFPAGVNSPDKFTFEIKSIISEAIRSIIKR
jgi:hypothetical protein